MRSLLLLAHAAVPLVTLSIWSNLPGQADSNTFQIAELPPLPQDTQQRSEPVTNQPDTSPSQTLWFKTSNRISLVELAESLELDPESFAQLNKLSVGHVFKKGTRFAVPDTRKDVAAELTKAIASDRPDIPSVTPPPPVSELAKVQRGDSLKAFLTRHGVTSEQLKDFNPGLKLSALTVGREVRVSKAVTGQSLLAIRPSISGGASWPDRPGLPSTNHPGFGGKIYSWPTKGVFTSGYGWRWGRMHKGIDIANNTGTPILASRDGIVAFAGWSGAYGYLVEISHGDGESTRYAHNSRLLVKKGQMIPRGARISLMGSTGRSTGPHLHFEIRRSGGSAINPLNKLPARKA